MAHIKQKKISFQKSQGRRGRDTELPLSTKKRSCEHARRRPPRSQEKRSQNETYLASTLILDFLASTLWERNLYYLSHPVYDILVLWQPRPTKTRGLWQCRKHTQLQRCRRHSLLDRFTLGEASGTESVPVKTEHLLDHARTVPHEHIGQYKWDSSDTVPRSEAVNRAITADLSVCSEQSALIPADFWSQPRDQTSIF